MKNDTEPKAWIPEPIRPEDEPIWAVLENALVKVGSRTYAVCQTDLIAENTDLYKTLLSIQRKYFYNRDTLTHMVLSELQEDLRYALASPKYRGLHVYNIEHKIRTINTAIALWGNP